MRFVSDFFFANSFNMLLVMLLYLYVTSFVAWMGNRTNPFLVLIVLELQLIILCTLFSLFSYVNYSIVGFVFALYIVAFAGAEASVGISLLISLYRLRGLFSFDFPAALTHVSK